MTPTDTAMLELPEDDFKLSAPPVPLSAALGFARELEVAIGEIANGRRKAGRIPLEPIARLVQFARDAASLQARVDAAEADAARYRHLRDNCCQRGWEWFTFSLVPFVPVVAQDKQTLDAAIDAARHQGEQP